MNATAAGRWRHLFRRLFRERQIILRSDDRVRGLTLTPRVQKAAFVLSAFALLWMAVGTAGILVQQERLSERERALADSRAEYSALIARIEDIGTQADDLAAHFDQDPSDADHAAAALEASGLPEAIARLRTDLTGLAAKNAELAERVAAARSDWRSAKERAATLAEERARLQERLAETEAALAAAQDRRRDLAGELESVRADLEAARAARQAEASGRLSAEREAEDLAEALSRTRRGERELLAEKKDLQDRLARSRAGEAELLAERRELADRVGRLEESLGQVAAEDTPDTLGRRIAGLEEMLLAAERRGDTLRRERDRLQGQVEELRAVLADVHKQHSGLFEHFATRARARAERIRRTIELTGLDADELIARVRRERPSSGGPFLPTATVRTDAAVGNDAAVGPSVHLLDEEMQRLAALQVALGAIPLVAPLESYWISSYFGRRRDPVNNHWARHEGIDLAAQKGSPVYAAAPGEVTVAGWKGAYGRMVEIDHGYGIASRYAHLQSISVEKGQEIGHREKIAKLGSSGRSTGPHVHYEILLDGKPIDPMNFLKAGRNVFKE